MSFPTKVLIVDDHPLIAKATCDLIAEIEGTEVVGMADSGEQCLEMTREHAPDIILLDFHLPDQPGDELAVAIKHRHPAVQIIIFTGIDITDLYNHFIKIGVNGIISKESSREVIKLMVQAIMNGQSILPQAVFRQVRLPQDRVESEQLTDDELHIMTLVTQGTTNDQIAKEIHMSKRSVDNYLRKIYDKLGVRGRAQAVERFLLRAPGHSRHN